MKIVFALLLVSFKMMANPRDWMECQGKFGKLEIATAISQTEVKGQWKQTEKIIYNVTFNKELNKEPVFGDFVLTAKTRRVHKTGQTANVETIDNGLFKLVVNYEETIDGPTIQSAKASLLVNKVIYVFSTCQVYE
jgi:hypothetical protein